LLAPWLRDSQWLDAASIGSIESDTPCSAIG
jgi:hypothetical protein